MNLPYFINIIFVSYSILLFVRVITSWIPNADSYHLVRFVAFYTDPYLGFFRRILPPLGGVLDISPILAFFALSLFEKLLLSFIQ